MGQEATLEPDNAQLAPGASRDYTAPFTWTAAPASSLYLSPPYNPYAQWVHQRCPGIYAFPYDDYGASNQSSDHTCTGATQLDVTFCPRGEAAVRRAAPPKAPLRAARDLVVFGE